MSPKGYTPDVVSQAIMGIIEDGWDLRISAGWARWRFTATEATVGKPILMATDDTLVGAATALVRQIAHHRERERIVKDLP